MRSNSSYFGCVLLHAGWVKGEGDDFNSSHFLIYLICVVCRVVVVVSGLGLPAPWTGTGLVCFVATRASPETKVGPRTRPTNPGAEVEVLLAV